MEISIKALCTRANSSQMPSLMNRCRDSPSSLESTRVTAPEQPLHDMTTSNLYSCCAGNGVMICCSVPVSAAPSAPGSSSLLRESLTSRAGILTSDITEGRKGFEKTISRRGSVQGAVGKQKALAFRCAEVRSGARKQNRKGLSAPFRPCRALRWCNR